MKLYKKIKCLMQQVNNLLNYEPALEFDETTNILTSTYINGQQASTELPLDNTPFILATCDNPTAANGSNVINSDANQISAYEEHLIFENSNNGTTIPNSTTVLRLSQTLLDAIYAPDNVYDITLAANQLTLLENGVPKTSVDLSLYLDDTNLARLVSGVVIGNILRVTRDDGTSFDIDVSSLLGGSTPTGLEAINEGNGVGWRLIGRDPANYGNIGKDAVDFGIHQLYTNRGALGEGSLVHGRDNITQAAWTFVSGADNQIGTSGAFSAVFGGLNNVTGNGNNAFVSGSNNTVQGGSNFVSGQVNTTESTSQSGFVAGGRNTLRGRNGFVAGWQNYSNSFAEISLGLWGTDYTASSTTDWVATDRLVNIGNGQDDLNRSDAFRILKGGEVFAPDLSNAKIDAATGDVMLTKNYLKRQIRTDKVTLTSSQIVASNTTPHILVANPGAGKMIDIIKISSVLRVNSTPFTFSGFGSGGYNFIYPGSSTHFRIPGGFVQRTVNSAAKAQVLTTGAYSENLIIEEEFTAQLVGTPTNAGDSEIDFYVTYEIIDL